MKRIQWMGWLLAGALLTAGLDWNAGWEAEPDDNEQISLGDNRIREFKDQIRKRMEVEHQVGQTGAAAVFDTGLHLLGSARVFDQTGAPTILGNDAGGYLASADANLTNALSQDEDTGAGTQDQGKGRLWVDSDGADGTPGNTDDNQMWVWNESTDLFDRPVVAQSANPTAPNLIYNGSFEITDGTGAVASALCPLAATGGGWANAAPNPTCTYQNPTGVSEGEGLAVNVTGTGAGGGIAQTLSSLKALKAYTIRARVNPTTAGDICVLRASDGTSNVTDTSQTGTGVYETLEVSITTTGAPAPVVVELETSALNDVCRWDHVTAFEQAATVSPPGVQAIYTQDAVQDATIDAVFGNNPFLSTPITIPSAGYIVLVDASVSLSSIVAGEECFARLVRDDCAGGAFTAVTPVVGGAGDFREGWSAGLHFVDVSPTVGGTCIYRVEVRGQGAASCVVNDLTAVSVVQTGSMLRLTLMPTR